ncbi:MAG: peptidoglycan DD-metalloendopeptidase family protein [Muribaculaceae bacterium]|nr:peptidoglycan DD-metalloendopeptidase family protein [Muribaculaceae bacterium]
MNRRFKYTGYILLIALAANLVPAWSAPKKKKQQKPKTETSADVKRQQEATQQEIKRTREKIQLNEQEVKKKLSELSKIGDNIAAGKVKVAQSAKEVESLKAEIEKLQSSIDAETRQLEKLRAEYLKTVKQMRRKCKQTSTLAFIFSSNNFNEAMRRMRYLKQFSKWRDDKSAEIEKHVADLKSRTEVLAAAKIKHDKALAENVAAQNSLQKQYVAQDAIVVELRKNGEALRSHLAKKQSEANALKNRVAALIAEEQRKAEAERKAAEEKRLQQEKLLAQQAEAERLAKEKAEAEKKAAAEAEKAKKETKKVEKEPKKEAKKPPKKDTKKDTKKEQKKEPQRESKKESEVSYAEARGRKPRRDANTSAKGSAPAKAPAKASSPAKSSSAASGASFAASKGSLPRPVGGHFRITSRFGANSLPEMPNVTYDNPGIDIETAKGAAASSVYSGTVSGVYMVPGYGTVVIVNHDGYYSVYGNLGQTRVAVGDKVKQGSILGNVLEDVDNPGFGMLHFEVWKNRDKQDPAAWIR